MRTTEKRLEKLEENVEKIEDEISDLKDELSNSLNEGKLSEVLKKEDVDLTTAMADEIEDYISSEQDGWTDDNINWKDDISNADKKGFDSYFQSNGKIKKQFCDKYGTNNIKECKNSLKKIKKLGDRLSQLELIQENLEERRGALEDEQFDRDIGLSTEADTESDALCWDCLDEVRELDKPTTGQIVGNSLAVLAGGAMSYYGYKAGKRDARYVNDLRLRQGYAPISTAGPAWAGASLGLPFVSAGIYGLAGGHSQFGHWACSPGYASGAAGAYAPFGPHASAGAQFGSPYGPFAGGNAGFQFGSPYGPFAGGNAGFQFGSPYGPFAGGGNAGFQFGSPYGPFAGGNAGLQFGSPYGPFAGGNAGLQFGSPYGPFGGNMGVNLQAQYQQQQYQQYLQFQQQQMQARLQAQQAWIQHQQSVQRDWMQRQQVIGGLTQELYKIQQQIQLVASGGINASGLALSGRVTLPGAVGGVTSPGGNAPVHQPSPQTPSSSPDGDLPVIIER